MRWVERRHTRRMEITAAMLRAARRAEFAYYRQTRLVGSRFVPMSDGMLRAVVEAAIGAIGEPEETEVQEPPVDKPQDEPEAVEPTKLKTIIVRASKPRPKRFSDR